MDLEYTYTRIDKQLVKEERIKTKSMNRLFKVYNTDSIKNRKVTWYMPLEVKINGYKEQIDVAVMDLNGMNIFLGYDWLVKHNLEIN